MRIPAHTLMTLPIVRPFDWFRSTPGGATVFLLPDEKSTATVLSWRDEGWRSASTNGQIAISVIVHGPAGKLTNRQLMELTGAHWVSRNRRRLPQWAGGPDDWYGEIAIDSQRELRLIKAAHHDCGAEPGRPCHATPAQPCEPNTQVFAEFEKLPLLPRLPQNPRLALATIVQQRFGSDAYVVGHTRDSDGWATLWDIRSRDGRLLWDASDDNAAPWSTLDHAADLLDLCVHARPVSGEGMLLFPLGLTT